MMGTKEKLKGGDEWDIFSRWRKYTRTQRYEVQKVKRKFWKRVRKIWRNKVKGEQE
jgi:hypothetical protein